MNKSSVIDRLSLKTVCLFLFLITLGFGLIYGLRLNIPAVLDEVGTLGNTSYMCGLDWSETIYSMDSHYYKYGASVVYYPLMCIFTSSAGLYKSIMFVNIALLSLISVFAYLILTKRFDMNKSGAFLLSVSVSVLPSAFLYSLYARADVFLIFLPWPVMYIILTLTDSNVRLSLFRRVLLSCLLSFLSVYAYMVHTRGIVLLIAVSISLLLARFILKKRNIELISFIAFTIGFMLLDKLISSVFYDAVYAEYGTLHASIESFDFAFLKKIFTADGFLSILKLAIGFLFNLLTSTFGLAGLAFIVFVAAVIRYIRFIRHAKKAGRSIEDSPSVADNELIFGFFSIILLLGTFAMGCLFFFPSAHRYYTGELVERSDRLIYGRYCVCAAGLPVLYALYMLCRHNSPVKLLHKLLGCVCYIGVFAVFMLKCAHYLEGVSANSRYFLSLCTFLKLDKYGSTTAVFSNIKSALLLAGLLGFVIGLAILFLYKLPGIKKAPVYGIVSAIFIVAGISLITVNYNKIRISRDKVLTESTAEPAALLLECSELAGEYPVLIDTSARDIKHYQFLLREFTTGSYCTHAAKADNCFIIAKKKYFVKDYYDNDYYTFECFDYSGAARDIVYVKGTALKKALEDKGYKLKKYKGKLKTSPDPDYPREPMP